MSDSPYAHLATVGPAENAFDQVAREQDQWDTSSWSEVFGPESESGMSGGRKWRAATPPPKATVEPLSPEQVAEVTHIWAESWREYADQKVAAVMRLTDDRWACVESWSDSSGYGCQDGTEWHVGATLDDVVRYGLTEEARQNLGLTAEGQ